MILEGVSNRAKREAAERMSLAWHIEALARHKKLPELAELLKDKTSKRQQTREEQIAIVRKWHAAIASRRR